MLSLYATGRTTGLVLDAGDGVEHVLGVYEGFSMKPCMVRANLAGWDLTTYMKTLLMEIGLNIETSSGFEIAWEIKEKCCYLALDYDSELKEFESSDKNYMKYELPDGSEVVVKS